MVELDVSRLDVDRAGERLAEVLPGQEMVEERALAAVSSTGSVDEPEPEPTSCHDWWL